MQLYNQGACLRLINTPGFERNNKSLFLLYMCMCSTLVPKDCIKGPDKFCVSIIYNNNIMLHLIYDLHKSYSDSDDGNVAHTKCVGQR